MLQTMPQYTSNDRNYSSRYWLDDSVFTKLVESTSLENIMSLYSIKNTISNFVRITSNKSVKVNYFGADSFAESEEKITISSELDDFDKVVGLALHESSHLTYSDLKMFQKLFNLIEHSRGASTEEIIISGATEELKPIIKRYLKIVGGKHNMYDHFSDIKNYMNWIEDRRIDNLQMKRFPGYKQYYDKLYSHYFYSNEITKALRSKHFRTPDFKSYMFRITNSLNKFSNPNALPKLNEIFALIDINNISKCNDNYEASMLALDVFEIVYNECKNSNGSGGKSNEKNNNEGKSTESSDDNDSDDSNNTDSDANNDSSSGDSNSNSDDSSTSGDSNDSNNNTNNSGDDDNDDNKEDDDNDEEYNPENSDEIKNDAEDKMEAIKSLLGQEDTKNKKLLNSQAAKTIQLLDSGELDILKPTDTRINAHVLSINKISDDVYRKFDRLFYGSSKYDDYTDRSQERKIKLGIANGRILGKKLQIMNDVKIIKTIRKECGNINNRLLPEIGFGNSRIFSHSRVEEFNKLYVYLTIDSSGSMLGHEWTSALQTAASIITALSYVANARIVVSTRATTSLGSGESAFNMVIYDSKVNNISHITKWWKLIRATGNTPEGFVFDALMDKILKDANGTDAYFINFSDGCPSCRSYNYTSNIHETYKADEAIEHTRKQVNKFIKAGISVVSYYISAYDSNAAFDRMYGKNAHYIDVCNITKLAASMNKVFMDRKRI